MKATMLLYQTTFVFLALLVSQQEARAFLYPNRDEAGDRLLEQDEFEFDEDDDGYVSANSLSSSLAQDGNGLPTGALSALSAEDAAGDDDNFAGLNDDAIGNEEQPNEVFSQQNGENENQDSAQEDAAAAAMVGDLNDDVAVSNSENTAFGEDDDDEFVDDDDEVVDDDDQWVGDDDEVIDNDDGVMEDDQLVDDDEVLDAENQGGQDPSKTIADMLSKATPVEPAAKVPSPSEVESPSAGDEFGSVPVSQEENTIPAPSPGVQAPPVESPVEQATPVNSPVVQAPPVYSPSAQVPVTQAPPVQSPSVQAPPVYSSSAQSPSASAPVAEYMPPSAAGVSTTPKPTTILDKEINEIQDLSGDRNVQVTVAVLLVFIISMFLCVAQQMFENPDGCCAKFCKCSIAIYRILCCPCRWMLGWTGRSAAAAASAVGRAKNRRTHKLAKTEDPDRYDRDDLEFA